MSSSLAFPISEIERIAASIEPCAPVALACDGTLEGILTSVFAAFATTADVQDIIEGSHVQPRIGQVVVAVPASMDAATRVQHGIVRTGGMESWSAVMTAAASDDPHVGTHIYRFVRYAFAAGSAATCSACDRKTTCIKPCGRVERRSILAQLTHPCVEPILRMQTQVVNETEKMRNFTRFQHVEGDLWFAKCNPSCSVVPFVMDHFGRRFNTQRFAIYDETHHIAGVSEGGKWQLVATDELAPPPIADDEAAVQDAWKRFYDALTIDARYNPELRRHFMPMRLWKNILELTP
ncbi:MAG: TIGR03915 family putative DNA repair protein [Eggerthellaceae bacterium]|nr:TIGR03915 family putative DNA repair protein [Eggerthellaceae bacterium]